MGALWWLNTLDDDLVAIISAAIGGLTLWVTIHSWGEPRAAERAVRSGMKEIRQIREYRLTMTPRRHG